MKKPPSPNTLETNGQLIEERRKFIRLNINVEINYTVLPETTTHTVGSKDIGAGGICLLADDALRLGDSLKLEFLLPEDPPKVQAIGRVVWVKPFSVTSDKHVHYDTGIEFIEIDSEDRKKINKYVFSLKLR